VRHHLPTEAVRSWGVAYIMALLRPARLAASGESDREAHVLRARMLRPYKRRWGWGESCATTDNGTFTPPTAPVADRLGGSWLIAGATTIAVIVQHGIDYLLDTQRAEANWTRNWPPHGFPSLLLNYTCIRITPSWR